MLVQYLTKGSTVEVTSDEDELKGVWFEATVLGFFGLPNSEKEEILVEYKSILADENSSAPLREYVDMSLVRPVPPKEKIERFELNDPVDASHKDGWWTAAITGVLEDSRYKVTFQNPPEELEFGISDLRFHRDWVKGNWVRPGRKQETKKSGDGESGQRKKGGSPSKKPISTPTGVSPARSLQQCGEMREKQDMPMQTPVNGTPTNQTETQSLPFVKTSLLWGKIESMDIFQRIPQAPHFSPLEKERESSRERLAIGCMVTFSRMAEKTSWLHIDDPRSTFDEILETLSDAEKHGFDVQPVRDRLTELLLMKDKKEKLEAQVADIGNQIMMHNTDRENTDGKIEEINKQIAEIQDKISLAISRKEVKDREIDCLRSQLEDTQVDMMNAHNAFFSIASKPL
ncbi:DUF724 domain-containing protein 10-like [Nicotiana tabacum]|uniref:DUF724 domain-containing protein 10-like n=1 Tax=Nicotiana tabacum TaxID=4097 RepID=A0A1S3Y4J6_TOBAC|nr:PREDICTED: uncharacterized protein LOC107772172 [Nicotiana tabacum]